MKQGAFADGWPPALPISHGYETLTVLAHVLVHCAQVVKALAEGRPADGGPLAPPAEPQMHLFRFCFS